MIKKISTPVAIYRNNRIVSKYNVRSTNHLVGKEIKIIRDKKSSTVKLIASQKSKINPTSRFIIFLSTIRAKLFPKYRLSKHERNAAEQLFTATITMEPIKFNNKRHQVERRSGE